MKLTKAHYMGIGAGFLLALIALIFFLDNKDLLFFLMGIAMTIVFLPFVFTIIYEDKRDQQIAEMFLEFARNLAESVNIGTPISKSIINMKRKNYGSLSPYIVKLANQIELGIPVDRALQTFAYDVNNPLIIRAVSLIQEAEKAGGEIDTILDSVAKSIAEMEKIKKERKAAISNLVLQGYIIFFIFIGIMLVMQFKIMPLTAGVSQLNALGGGGFDASSPPASQDSSTPQSPIDDISRSFLYLLMAQGFFTGLTIGKIAEGSIKSGIKHSFIMVIGAVLISTGAKVILG